MINPYAAGNKVYGGGRPHPTQGPVDPSGYVEREANKRSPQQNAAAQKLRAIKDKNYMSADFLRGPVYSRPNVAAAQQALNNLRKR